MQSPVMNPYAALMANPSAAFLWHQQQQQQRQQQQPPLRQQHIQTQYQAEQSRFALHPATSSASLMALSQRLQQQHHHLPTGSATISPISPEPQHEHQAAVGSPIRQQAQSSGMHSDADPLDRTPPQRSRARPPRPSRSGRPKRNRTIFTPEQLKRLEQGFSSQMYLVGNDRIYLAQSLNLTEAQVKVWFQNRRIKQRKLEAQPKEFNQAAPKSELDE